MKGLDTPVLLALLEGNPRAVARVRKWRGEELATTEANLLEMAAIAARSPARHRTARLTALGRLRRRLTVLPIGSQAVEEASRHLAAHPGDGSLLSVVIAAAFEAGGCDEILTDEPAQFGTKWRVRCSKL